MANGTPSLDELAKRVADELQQRLGGLGQTGGSPPESGLNQVLALRDLLRFTQDQETQIRPFPPNFAPFDPNAFLGTGPGGVSRAQIAAASGFGPPQGAQIADSVLGLTTNLLGVLPTVRDLIQRSRKGGLKLKG